MGPIDPRAHPPQERMRPILFWSWDLSEHEKWMPPSSNWEGLPVGRHLVEISRITFSPITQFLG